MRVFRVTVMVMGAVPDSAEDEIPPPGVRGSVPIQRVVSRCARLGTGAVMVTWKPKGLGPRLVKRRTAQEVRVHKIEPIRIPSLEEINLALIRARGRNVCELSRCHIVRLPFRRAGRPRNRRWATAWHCAAAHCAPSCGCDR